MLASIQKGTAVFPAAGPEKHWPPSKQQLKEGTLGHWDLISENWPQRHSGTANGFQWVYSNRVRELECWDFTSEFSQIHLEDLPSNFIFSLSAYDWTNRHPLWRKRQLQVGFNCDQMRRFLQACRQRWLQYWCCNSSSFIRTGQQLLFQRWNNNNS